MSEMYGNKDVLGIRVKDIRCKTRKSMFVFNTLFLEFSEYLQSKDLTEEVDDEV